MPDASSSLPTKWYPCSTSVSEIGCVRDQGPGVEGFPVGKIQFPASEVRGETD